MLRPEDCKPGVEVIAIKNHSNTVNLSIGMIYTIKQYSNNYCEAVTLNVRHEGVISLNEVAPMNGFTPAFKLDQFKLRDPDELNQLFNLDNIDADLLKEKDFETI